MQISSMLCRILILPVLPKRGGVGLPVIYASLIILTFSQIVKNFSGQVLGDFTGLCVTGIIGIYGCILISFVLYFLVIFYIVCSGAARQYQLTANRRSH
jgi:hypothetical protein